MRPGWGALKHGNTEGMENTERGSESHAVIGRGDSTAGRHSRFEPSGSLGILTFLPG